jgi:Flp pilus assembly protein CpaB
MIWFMRNRGPLVPLALGLVAALYLGALDQGKHAIAKSEQITSAGLSLKLQPEYHRALIAVGPEFKSLIKPGDRIDVLMTFNAKMSSGRREKITATILQDIPVIAVGNNLDHDRSAGLAEKWMISVAVNPEAFAYLTLAAKQGEVIVRLTGSGDAVIRPMAIIGFRKLFR